MKSKRKNYNLVITSIFISIIFLQSVVPVLGYIPMGFINATIIQATVAVGAIILGYKRGCILGFVFGITSLLKNTFSPNPSSFIFSPFIPDVFGNYGGIKSLIICFLPRILIGFASSKIFIELSKVNGKNKKFNLFISGFISSMVNTVLVMLMIFLFFNKEFSEVKNMAVSNIPKFIMGLIFTQGIVEAVLSGFICLSVVLIIKKAYKE